MDEPVAVLRLPLPRLDKFKDSIYWKYGFSMTAHEVTIKFSAGNREEANRWYEKLKRHCNVVLLRFSRHYNMGKVVKKQGYVKTQMATHNETGARYVIKSIIKAMLFESSIALVNQDSFYFRQIW